MGSTSPILLKAERNRRSRPGLIPVAVLNRSSVAASVSKSGIPNRTAAAISWVVMWPSNIAPKRLSSWSVIACGRRRPARRRRSWPPPARLAARLPMPRFPGRRDRGHRRDPGRMRDRNVNLVQCLPVLGIVTDHRETPRRRPVNFAPVPNLYASRRFKYGQVPDGVAIVVDFLLQHHADALDDG